MAPAGTSTVSVVEVASDATADTPPVKYTVLEEAVEPINPVPAIVIVDPMTPFTGTIPSIVLIAGTTTKLFVVAGDVPETVVTVRGPVVAVAGTITCRDDEVTEVGVATAPLKLTWVAPVKLVPFTCTVVPVVAEAVNVVILGKTPKSLTDWTVMPPNPSDIFPVEAPEGTIALSCVSLEIVKEAVTLLNFTKVTVERLDPVMVTTSKVLPEVGLKLAIAGWPFISMVLLLVPDPEGVVTTMLLTPTLPATGVTLTKSELTWLIVVAILLILTDEAPVNVFPLMVIWPPTTANPGKLIIFGVTLKVPAVKLW